MPTAARSGIREHGLVFSLLVVLNAFVGGMVGLERTVVPLLAEAEFGIASAAAATSFIVTFALAKALTNGFAGTLSDRLGRRPVLIAGWVAGLPVPLILLWAPAWEWVLFANVLLGLNQGLAWSMTVVMKVDLAAPTERGLATGLNEFAGYAGLALVALATGFVAAKWSLRPEPFYLGLGLAGIGFVLAWLTPETQPESSPADEAEAPSVSGLEVAKRSTLTDRALSSSSLAGLATNLKDGMLWGLLPLLLTASGLGVDRVGIVVALYPGVWAASQLVSGPLSDRVGRRVLIVPGLALQSVGVAGFALAGTYLGHLGAAVAVGLGTGLVYPTLLAFVADASSQAWQASALGAYRFWRDMGYVVGALGAGLIADAWGLGTAVWSTAGLVAAVMIVFWWRTRAPRRPRGDGSASSRGSPS